MANIQDVRAIHNPQKAYMWEVEIQGLSTGSLNELSFYAKTVSIPQSAVEQMIINHKASRTHHAGRDASSHTVSITFWDDEARTIHNFFQEWMDNLIHNPILGGGVSRDLYAADLVIRLKDASDENATGTFRLARAFPIDIPDVPLSYDTSDVVEITVTLSFDEKIVS